MTKETCWTSIPLAQTSVVINTLVVPPLNSAMMASLSFCGMSPCIDDTVKLFFRIFSVNQSTFFFVFTNITACVMVKVSYKSHSVSNFHSSFSTATKNCLIPSNVNSSLLTKIRIGSVMNFDVMSKTSFGSVADIKTTCVSGGRYRYMSYICSLNPLFNISSASSRINVLIFFVLKLRLLIISKTLPGVPETMCTP